MYIYIYVCIPVRSPESPFARRGLVVSRPALRLVQIIQIIGPEDRP